MAWTSKNKRGEKQRWLVFAGLAYPRVMPGANPTTRVTSHPADRDSFYHDPAIMLSDADLDRFNGTEGKPLCVEHNMRDRVGDVLHSWLGNGRSLKIIGRVSLETPRGRQVAAEIQAKKFKGLSVGYGTDLVTNNATGVTELDGKNFREISLVHEPFFDGCYLSDFKVTASKNLADNNGGQNSHLVFRVDASREILMESSSTNNGAAGAAQPPVSGNELLEQAAQLKSQLSEETKAKEQQAQEMAKMQAEMERLRKLEAAVKAKEQAEAEAYAKEQMPKYEAYVQELTASKTPLSEDMKHDLKVQFTDPRFRDVARFFEAQHKERMELLASKKEMEDKLKAEQEEKKKLESAMSKTSQVLNHSRSEFAAALGQKDSKDDETRRKTVPQDSTSFGEVNASGGLERICCPEPGLEEMEFLRCYNFRPRDDLVGVNASSSLYNGGRVGLRSVPVAASHSVIRDEDGNLNNPNSGRFGEVPQQLFFSWMCSRKELVNGDLSDVARMRQDKNTIERRPPKDHMMNMPVGATPASATTMV